MVRSVPQAASRPSAPPRAGEQQALGEQLPQQAPARGAHRQADGNLFRRPTARASSRFARLAQAITSTRLTAARITAPTPEHRTPPFGIVHEGRGVHQKRGLAAGVLAVHGGSDDREIGAGAGEGDAGLQAAGHFEPAHVGIGQVIALPWFHCSCTEKGAQTSAPMMLAPLKPSGATPTTV